MKRVWHLLEVVPIDKEIKHTKVGWCLVLQGLCLLMGHQQVAFSRSCGYRYSWKTVVALQQPRLATWATPGNTWNALNETFYLLRRSYPNSAIVLHNPGASFHRSPAPPILLSLFCPTPRRGVRHPLSRSRERKAASTTDVYGRRSSGSGGVSAGGGDEKGPGSRHPSSTSAGGDGFRLNLERAITTRMQEQLQVHR